MFGKKPSFLSTVCDFYGHIKSVLLYYYRYSVQEACIKIKYLCSLCQQDGRIQGFIEL